MADLVFRYGTMDSGKTVALLTAAHQYDKNDKEIRIIKSIKDTKGEDTLSSRTGLSRKVDIIIGVDESFEQYFEDWNNNVHCIFVDEAQFLSKKQIDELWFVAHVYELPVICYGLRTNFQSNSFEGSRRLLELADSLEEINNICSCGQKAKFNGRKIDDEFVFDGDEVIIDDGKTNIEYVPLCPKCYIKKRNNSNRFID